MENLFREIDALQLNDRLLQWKEARRAAPITVCVERERLALESWQETEGEDIEIRRAKLFQKLTAGAPINILETDLIVCRLAAGMLETVTQSDLAGDYIPGLWEDADELALTMTVKGAMSRKNREVVREAARYFHKRSAPAHVLDAWHKVVGTWADDMEEGKLKDPWQSAAFFPSCVASPLWSKVLANGLRDFIGQARRKFSGSWRPNRPTSISSISGRPQSSPVRQPLRMPIDMPNLPATWQRKRRIPLESRNCWRLPGSASGSLRTRRAPSTRPSNPYTLSTCAKSTNSRNLLQ